MSRTRELGALAACLALVAGISATTGDLEDTLPVDYDDVGLGEVGVAREFEVTALEVQLAAQVSRGYGEPLATDGVFVVVPVVTSAVTDSVRLGEVWLVTTDGARYATRDEVTTAFPPITPPGFTSTGTFVFQVPADRVAGALLLVEPDIDLFEVYDTTVRVDLGLTADTPVDDGPVVLDDTTTAVTG